MNKKTSLMAMMLIPIFSACSTQSTQSIQNTQPDVIHSEASVPVISINNSLSISGLTKEKTGKVLNLVRVMEGGVCKNNRQGATGLFKLYANIDEITNIQHQHGTEVFADFELLIQGFSMKALQKAIYTLDFEETSNILNNRQQKLAEKLSLLFIELISDDITQFETKTKLTIDVIPNIDTLTMYVDGCNIPHEH